MTDESAEIPAEVLEGEQLLAELKAASSDERAARGVMSRIATFLVPSSVKQVLERSDSILFGRLTDVREAYVQGGVICYAAPEGLDRFVGSGSIRQAA